jgi:hypothetical protein
MISLRPNGIHQLFISISFSKRLAFDEEIKNRLYHELFQILLFDECKFAMLQLMANLPIFLKVSFQRMYCRNPNI